MFHVPSRVDKMWIRISYPYLFATGICCEKQYGTEVVTHFHRGQKYASTFPGDPAEEQEVVDKTHGATSLAKVKLSISNRKSKQ